jgi:FMN phosphatase YigB (HAD superfamily)
VGDDPIADVKGARDVGMKTAFVKRKEVEANADIEIGQIAELATLL